MLLVQLETQIYRCIKIRINKKKRNKEKTHRDKKDPFSQRMALIVRRACFDRQTASSSFQRRDAFQDLRGIGGKVKSGTVAATIVTSHDRFDLRYA